MLRAGIDLGTNTFLLLVADVSQGKITKVIQDEVRVVRLGQGVDQHKAFQVEAMERAEKCFTDYGKILRNYPGITCKVVATSGSRDAKNSVEFFRKMERVLGFPITVISGEAEAGYSFAGALSDCADHSQYVVIDIGGGSTEIVTQGENRELLRKSFDVGCVRMTERYLKHDPPTMDEIQIVREYVRGLLAAEKNFIEPFMGKNWIGVAGTATYLMSSALELTSFDPERVHRSYLKLSDLSALLDRFSKLTSRSRLGIGGMDAGRADVIVGGAIILEEFMKFVGKSEIEISVRGLRYGLVL